MRPGRAQSACAFFERLCRRRLRSLPRAIRSDVPTRRPSHNLLDGKLCADQFVLCHGGIDAGEWIDHADTDRCFAARGDDKWGCDLQGARCGSAFEYGATVEQMLSDCRWHMFPPKDQALARRAFFRSGERGVVGPYWPRRPSTTRPRMNQGWYMCSTVGTIGHVGQHGFLLRFHLSVRLS